MPQYRRQRQQCDAVVLRNLRKAHSLQHALIDLYLGFASLLVEPCPNWPPPLKKLPPVPHVYGRPLPSMIAAWVLPQDIALIPPLNGMTKGSLDSLSLSEPRKQRPHPNNSPVTVLPKEKLSPIATFTNRLLLSNFRGTSCIYSLPKTVVFCEMVGT